MVENKGRSVFVFDEKHDIDLTPEVLAFELSMDFADQVIDECIRQGLSHVELAEILKIKPSTLSEKLNGQNLTLKSIASMALALDCDVKAPALVRKEESSRVRPEYLHESAGMMLRIEAPMYSSAFTGGIEREGKSVHIQSDATSSSFTNASLSYSPWNIERKVA